MKKNLKLSYFGDAPSYDHVRFNADRWLWRLNMGDDLSIKYTYNDLFVSSRTLNDVVGMTILFHVMEYLNRYWTAKVNDGDSQHFRDLSANLRGKVVAYVRNAHGEGIMTDDDVSFFTDYVRGLCGDGFLSNC